MDDVRRDGSVREMRPEDRDAVVEVVRASGLLSAEDVTEVEQYVDAFLEGAAPGDAWLIATTPDDDPIGVAYYARERMTERTWNLFMLAVDADHQGRGHGAALVRRVEAALSADSAVLLVETSGTPEFAGQRAFYAGLGYHQEARIRDFFAPGDDKVVFWKTLSAGETS